MKRRAFLKQWTLAASGLFIPRIARPQAFTFYDPRVYRAKPFGINPIVSNWASRVVTNGGANPSANTQAALSNFVNTLQGASIWSKMITVNCVAPDNLTAAITPLLVSGNDPWTNTGPFIAGDLLVTGLLGNGISKYLKTGTTHTALGTTTAGVSWYVRSNGTNHGFDAGGYDGTNGLIVATKHTDFKTYAYNGNISNNAIVIATSPGNGFYCDLRVSNVNHKLYFANSGNAFAQIGTSDTTLYNGTAFAGTMYGWAIDLSGGLQFPAQDEISFMAFHSGVTATDGATLFSAVQTMRTALGGGYV